MSESRTPPARLSRRILLAGAAAGAAAIALPARSAEGRPVRAIAFDAFPIFDIRRIGMLARTLVPEKGEALAGLWLPKLFGYTWLATAAGRYQDFETLADAALRFSAASLKIELPDQTRATLVAAFGDLEPWPDVKPALARLGAAGIRLAFLTNLGERAVTANLRRAGIADAFVSVLSTDRVRQFKPSPVAYGMGVEAFGLPKEEIGFAAFGGWDAVGATWFGYRTAWINRTGVAAETLDVRPEIVTPGMEGVLALAGIS